MGHIGNLVSWRKHRGEAISIGETTVIPTSQAVTIRLPFGGFVWNRPLSVMVTTNGETDQFAIVDVTRLVLLATTAVTLAVTLFAWSQRRQR